MSAQVLIFHQSEKPPEIKKNSKDGFSSNYHDMRYKEGGVERAAFVFT